MRCTVPRPLAPTVRRFPVVVAAAALSLFGAAAARGAAGDLDPTFGTAGIVKVNFAAGSTTGESAFEARLQSDGKIVTVGVSTAGNVLRLSRFLASGSLDSTFGPGGSVLHTFAGLVNAGSLAIDSAGRLVVAGSITVAGDQEVFVARFTTTGAVDTTFGGGDGWMSFDSTTGTASAGTEMATAVVVDASDRPIAGGWADANGNIFNPSDRNLAVARLDTDGNLDPTFGTGGISLATVGNGLDDDVRAMALDATGRIVVIGVSFPAGGPSNTVLARWLPTGALDTSFDGDGVRFLDLDEGGGSDGGFDLAFDGAGHILALGFSGGDDPTVARLLDDGSLDTAWAGDGIVRQSFIGGQDVTEHVLVQADDKVLVTGWPVVPVGSGRFHMAVQRFTAAGVRDTTFGSGGVVTTSTSFNERIYAAALLPDQRILVAGGYDNDAGLVMARYLPEGCVVGGPTTTTISSDLPDPSDVSQPVSVAYSVVADLGGTPTGNVVVSDGAATCTGTVADGGCSLVLTTAGARTLTATYGGTALFCASSDTEGHVVREGTVTTITGDAPDASLVGEPVPVSVTVAPASGSGGPPTGTVMVSDTAGATCSGALSAGSMSCTLTPKTAGERTWTAAYAGDGSYAASSDDETHTVQQAATTTSITADTPDPSLPGQTVTVGVTVAPVSPGGGIPGGGVTVDDGAGATCAITLAAGSGSCDLVLALAGDRTLTATFAGDADYSGSSDTEAHHVDAVGIAASYAATPGSAPETGGTLTFSVQVTNTGDRALTLDSLASTTFGDLDAAGTCDVPQTIAPLASYSCAFLHAVSGVPGPASDTLAASASTGSLVVGAGDGAEYNLTDVLPLLDLTLTADPATVGAPGGDVELTVLLHNPGSEPVTVTALADDVVGNLATACQLPQTLAGGASHSCAYEDEVQGDVGDSETHTVSGSAGDDDGNSVQASDSVTVDVADLSGPRVSSVRDGGNGDVPGCATLRRAISAVRVTFDQDVVGAAQSASYRLVGAGADGDVAPVECTDPLGADDVELAIASATSDGAAGHPTVTLGLTGPLPDGLVRLLVCPAIEDAAGNPLDGDGDGTGGDAFARTFRVDRDNLFAEGHFDRCPVSLAAWTTEATPPNSVDASETVDADDSPLSGSVEVFSSSIDPSGLGQCVAIARVGDHRLSFRARLDGVGGATATATGSCHFFSAGGCGGASLGIVTQTAAVPDLAGAWSALQISLAAPPASQSAACAVALAPASAAEPVFTAYLDDLGFVGPLFADGFESGAVNEWSGTTP